MRNPVHVQALSILLSLLPSLAAAADLPDTSGDACRMVQSAANQATVRLPFQTVEGRRSRSGAERERVSTPYVVGTLHRPS